MNTIEINGDRYDIKCTFALPIKFTSGGPGVKLRLAVWKNGKIANYKDFKGYVGEKIAEHIESKINTNFIGDPRWETVTK